MASTDMRRTWVSCAATLVLSFSVGIASAAPILQQVSPGSITFVPDTDFATMENTSIGDVTAAVTPVDLALGLGNASTSGCDAADFAGFAAGSIALIQRGACTFQLKAENAAAAGAVGVLIFNQGNTVDRTGLFGGTLSAGYAGGIPVLALTYGLGEQFAATSGLTVRMVVHPEDVTPNPVPEPTVLALLSIGLAGLAWRGVHARRSQRRIG